MVLWVLAQAGCNRVLRGLTRCKPYHSVAAGCRSCRVVMKGRKRVRAGYSSGLADLPCTQRVLSGPPDVRGSRPPVCVCGGWTFYKELSASGGNAFCDEYGSAGTEDAELFFLAPQLHVLCV